MTEQVGGAEVETYHSRGSSSLTRSYECVQVGGFSLWAFSVWPSKSLCAGRVALLTLSGGFVSIESVGTHGVAGAVLEEVGGCSGDAEWACRARAVWATDWSPHALASRYVSEFITTSSNLTLTVLKEVPLCSSCTLIKSFSCSTETYSYVASYGVNYKHLRLISTVNTISDVRLWSSLAWYPMMYSS